MTTKITYRELANAIIEADTADWAEPYEVIRDRVWSGFEDIAHHREKWWRQSHGGFPWTNNFLFTFPLMQVCHADGAGEW